MASIRLGSARPEVKLGHISFSDVHVRINRIQLRVFDS
jgi:hypothetical protein